MPDSRTRDAATAARGPAADAPPSRGKILAALLSVYLIWGSTYLAIRFAIESIPPLWMAGTRYLVAGAALYAWARGRGSAPPQRAHWRSAALVGALLLVGGNGGVTWAEQYLASGLAALLIATVPLWVVLLEWALERTRRPAGSTLLAVAMGIGGVALIVGPASLIAGERPHALGTAVTLAAALTWSLGSLASRRVPLPASPLLGVAMQMLCGGGLLVLCSLAVGEGARINLGAITMRSALAWLYLVTFGSVVAFTAYVWLLRVMAPVKVATYAFVNPVVAVLLGAWLAAEPLTPRMALAACVIVGAVGIITLLPARR